MSIIRSQNHLAELLGISKGAASRLAARGMPTDSLEAAQAWRKTHLNPSRVKGARFDAYRKPHQPAPRAHQDANLVHASALMTLASDTLDGGKTIDALVPTLRAAMAAVPRHERDAMGISMPVWEVLLGHVLDRLPPKTGNLTTDDGTPFYCDGETMSDEEAQSVGEDWYRIACGEIQIPGCSYE